jgi:hypothetical protein
VSKKTKPAKAGWEKLEGASPDAPKIFRQCMEHCPPENLLFAIRYSPLAASKGWVAKFASGCDNLLAG